MKNTRILAILFIFHYKPHMNLTERVVAFVDWFKKFIRNKIIGWV